MVRVVTVRMTPELHAELKLVAGEGVQSMNKFCVDAIDAEVKRGLEAIADQRYGLVGESSFNN